MNTNIRDHILLVGLTIRVFSGVKTDKKVSEEITTANHAAPDSGRFQKHILGRDALKGISVVADAARAFHYERTLPGPMGKMGIISVGGYLDYTERLRDYNLNFQKAVDAFIDVYPTLVREAKITLNGLFNEKDYPAIDELAAQFQFKSTCAPFPTGNHWFPNLSDDIVASLKAEFEESIASSVAEARTESLERARELVRATIEKLNAYAIDPNTGKLAGRRFHDTVVTNLRDFADSIPGLNIGGDPEFDALADAFRHAGAYEAAALRADPGIRTEVVKRAQVILDKLDSLAG